SLIATEASIHEPLIEPRLPFGTAHSRDLGYWKAQETQFAQDLKPADSCNTPEKGSSAPQWEYGCRREAARTAFPFAENTAEKHRILSDRHGKRPTGCMATLRVHFMRGSVEAAFFDPLERLNGEIKRRSDVVGIFPTKMPLRLVGASCSNRTANG